MNKCVSTCEWVCRCVCGCVYISIRGYVWESVFLCEILGTVIQVEQKIDRYIHTNIQEGLCIKGK